MRAKCLAQEHNVVPRLGLGPLAQHQIHQYPFIHLGEERQYDESKVSCLQENNTVSRLGPGSLHPESSALTDKPPRGFPNRWLLSNKRKLYSVFDKRLSSLTLRFHCRTVTKGYSTFSARRSRYVPE